LIALRPSAIGEAAAVAASHIALMAV
jgi:hypothetical protein